MRRSNEDAMMMERHKTRQTRAFPGIEALTATLLLFLSATGYAATGGAWLEIGAGGRAAALGEAMTAAVEGPTATYWNPAAVGLAGNRAEVMHAAWIGEANSQYLATDFDLGAWGLGFSALHVGIDDLELRSGPSAEPEGSFQSRNIALGFSVARALPIKSLRLGVSGRYLKDKLYMYDAEGYAFDIGLLQRGLLKGHLDVGLSVRHLGEMGALKTEEYDLPVTYSAGVQYHVLRMGIVEPSVMLDVVQVADYDLSLRGGLEVKVSEYFYARGGYASGYDARGVSGGFGLQWNGWRFEYAYTPFTEDLGNAQRFSFGMQW
ncbi:PorV/PorQ family protein [bacterium]|nr:PorV/PorQ family protein [bacterium]